MPPPDHRPALRHLGESDPVLGKVIAQVGPCALAPAEKVNLFEALLESIIYQQLHGKAAEAIHGRVLKAIRRPTPAALHKISDGTLRQAGLSAAKLRAIRDLAAKTREGTVPQAAAVPGLSDEELIERLTVVRGIGPWTVHMLLIFHLGRQDVMPTGDYGIRKAFSLLYRRGRAVTPEALLRHAKRWQPYRSIASWYLWRSLDIALPDGRQGSKN